jgi:hypothetical protein
VRYANHPLIGYTPNPNSPLEQYGQTQSPFRTFAAGAVTALLADPEIQALVNTVGVQCQQRAQDGVNEWMKTNWGYLIAAGATLVGLNYLVLVFGVLPTVQRAARGR